MNQFIAGLFLILACGLWAGCGSDPEEEPVQERQNELVETPDTQGEVVPPPETPVEEPPPPPVSEEAPLLPGRWELTGMVVSGIPMSAEEAGNSVLIIRDDGLLITKVPDLEPMEEPFTYREGVIVRVEQNFTQRIEKLTENELVLVELRNGEETRFEYRRIR